MGSSPERVVALVPSAAGADTVAVGAADGAGAAVVALSVGADSFFFSQPTAARPSETASMATATRTEEEGETLTTNMGAQPSRGV
jgi:Ca2+/Na+ antiporter